MKNYKAKDVGAYIASADSKARPKLTELRKIIKSAIPKVEEKISWGIPFYKYHGFLIGFAAFKNHVSFGFAFPLPSKDREELLKKGYKTGSKTIQIKFDQKVPTTAIKQILKTRAKTNKGS
ncbi:MAG: DUF1801 domain-containing protein [Patescibacteria group bacterium]|nr:DUF1801 domain-containing protein [Patescibacteria group bacterium]